MPTDKQDQSLTILVIAANAGDVSLTLKVLIDAGMEGKVCVSIQALQAAMLLGAGAILVAEEVLFPLGLEPLKQALQSQPPWSDIPIIVMTKGGDMTEARFEILKALDALRNVTLLDRPVRLMTIISILRAALKARERQYEMRDLLEKYRSSSEIAESASRAKSSFLANMSHEIRTPLNAIMGFGDLLLDETTSSQERADFVSTIQKNGKLLTQIIDDILDLSKVEAGKLTVEKVNASLAELVEEVMLVMKQKAKDKGIGIKVRTDPSVPSSITTDPTRLKQILLNIIGNAVKFTQKGQVDVSITMQEAAPSEKKKLAFIVRDSGRGISAEQKEQLFQAFVQADTSTTRKFGGTGLGLILSRRLAEALGGGLELTASEADVGSVFTITIEANNPQACCDKSPEFTRVGASHGFKDGLLQGVSILVVEDVPDNQHLMRQILNRCGATVELAENGQVGVEKASRDEYDLILMDLQMPVKDGLEATAELRRQGYRKPIIAVSAAAMLEERERAILFGCDDHITKPIKLAVLLKAVCLHTGRLEDSIPGQ